MPYTLLIHLANADPIMAEIEELPGPQDQTMVISNPRQRDGKDLAYVLPEVQTLVFPLSRVTFIEVMPTEEEEDIFSFVRE